MRAGYLVITPRAASSCRLLLASRTSTHPPTSPGGSPRTCVLYSLTLAKQLHALALQVVRSELPLHYRYITVTLPLQVVRSELLGTRVFVFTEVPLHLPLHLPLRL